MPLGNAQAGQQVFCECDDAFGRNLFLALFDGLRILLSDGGPHRRDATAQHSLRYGTLSLGQVGENNIDACTSGLQSLELGSLRKFGGSLEKWSARTTI